MQINSENYWYPSCENVFKYLQTLTLETFLFLFGNARKATDKTNKNPKQTNKQPHTHFALYRRI